MILFQSGQGCGSRATAGCWRSVAGGSFKVFEAPRPRTRDPCSLRIPGPKLGISTGLRNLDLQDLLGVKRVGSCRPQEREFILHQSSVHRGFEAEKFLVS